jgi:hypothetical protein
VALHPLGPLTVVGAAAFAAGIDEWNPGLTRRLQSWIVLGPMAAAWVLVWLIRLLAARR